MAHDSLQESYISAHVVLNFLNELRKIDKMRGLPSILSLIRNELNTFNNTIARKLHEDYLESKLCRKNVINLSV